MSEAGLDLDDEDRRERRLETLDEIVTGTRDLGVNVVAYAFVGAGVATVEEITPSGELAYLGRIPLDL